jgi:hypothetical protein
MQTSILFSLLWKSKFLLSNLYRRTITAEGGKVERLPSSNCRELNDEMEKENDDDILLPSLFNR